MSPLLDPAHANIDAIQINEYEAEGTCGHTRSCQLGWICPSWVINGSRRVFEPGPVIPSTTDMRDQREHVSNVPTADFMHRSKQRLYSITSSARVRRQLNSTPSLRTVSAYARSPIIVANACSSASSPRASAGTSVNPSGPAASRVDFRRSRLGAKSSAARRLGAKPRRSAKADIGLAARTARG